MSLTDIKVKVVRTNGFPTYTVAKKSGGKLELLFDPDSGFTLKGSQRSVEDPDLWQALRLIYPTGSIPDPKVSPITFMDATEPVFANADDIQNADVLLYTVPRGRSFYLYYIDFNTYPDNPAVLHGGSLYYNDGVNDYDLMVVGTSANGTGQHTTVAFNCLKIPNNWTFRVFSEVNSHVHCTILGVLL